MDGTLSVRKINDAWAATTPDGTQITVDQATYGIPEAIAHAAENGNLPLFIYGMNEAEPFAFSNYTLQIPAAVASQIHCFGCYFRFDNTGTTLPGIQIDTLSYGSILNCGGRIAYAGDGVGVLIRPENSVPSGAQANPITKWARNGSYDLGTVFATGGTPEALVCIDPTGATTPDPQADPNGFLTTCFVANLANGLRFVGEGYGYAKHGLWLKSPLNARQLISQNKFQFYIESCTISEIKLGGDADGIDGPALGTNILIGNPTHTIAGGAAVVECNGAMNQFYLNSCNIETPGASYNIDFGQQSYGNNVATRQMFGGALGIINDNCADPNNANTFTFGDPQKFNQIGTSGEPFTTNLAAGTYTYIDMSWKVPNGHTVKALGLYATEVMTVPLILVRRNSASDFTEIVTQIISHDGSGWQDVAIQPTAIPNDGLDYYLGVFTENTNQTFVDYKARGLYPTQISGTVSGVTEQSPHAQWYVVPLRVTYQ